MEIRDEGLSVVHGKWAHPSSRLYPAGIGHGRNILVKDKLCELTKAHAEINELSD